MLEVTKSPVAAHPRSAQIGARTVHQGFGLDQRYGSKLFYAGALPVDGNGTGYLKTVCDYVQTATLVKLSCIASLSALHLALVVLAALSPNTTFKPSQRRGRHCQDGQ